MNDTKKRKAASEAITRAEMARDIIFLHRLRWGCDHAKLNRLLSEMYSAEERHPPAPAPAIEISFRDARYYIIPEYIADFGLRLYSDYTHRRPPFTDDMVRKYYTEALNSEETQEMLAALLSGGIDPEDIPEADQQPRPPV